MVHNKRGLIKTRTVRTVGVRTDICKYSSLGPPTIPKPSNDVHAASTCEPDRYGHNGFIYPIPQAEIGSHLD